MRFIAFAVCSALAANVALGDVLSPAPDASNVTIYRVGSGETKQVANMDEPAGGIGMITETRTLDLPAGESVVRFRGVAETIVPQSAKLTDFNGAIVETNFDYQLLGPGALIANSLGQSVDLVRTDNLGTVTSTPATLLSGPNGVLLDVNGKVEALGCSGARERLVFHSIPASLTDQPTLSAKVRVKSAGQYVVSLSYLATGFDWSADYVASINSDGRTLNLLVWATLANKQSTSFTDAPVQVIAGNISVDEETRPVEATPIEQQSMCWPIGRWFTLKEFRDRLKTADMLSAPAPIMRRMVQAEALQEVVVTGSYIAKQRELGDYKLYSLPAPTTVAGRQVKQVKMLDEHKVPFERVYTYVTDPEEIGADDKPVIARPTAILRLQNKKERGLGKPLPAGTVSVYAREGQASILVGEDSIQDGPVGLPVDVILGEAMDIAVEPKVVREYVSGFGSRKRAHVDFEVIVTNNKSVAIVLEYLQRISDDTAMSIVKESTRHTFKHGMPMWSVRAKSGERVVLRYTVQMEDPNFVDQ